MQYSHFLVLKIENHAALVQKRELNWILYYCGCSLDHDHATMPFTKPSDYLSVCDIVSCEFRFRHTLLCTRISEYEYKMTPQVAVRNAVLTWLVSPEYSCLYSRIIVHTDFQSPEWTNLLCSLFLMYVCLHFMHRYFSLYKHFILSHSANGLHRKDIAVM